MPARPPKRACVDCGRPIQPGWQPVGRCKVGRGCRIAEPPKPGPTQTVPF